jgi:serine/threonine-protein kinase
MAAMRDSPVKPGDVLAGKYRVERELGVGGMGIVVAARHLDLDQLVAVKLMLQNKGGNVEGQKRFVREARAAARLRSQHVGRVLDVGTLENGTPYMVMEYLEGRDLASLLESRGTLEVGEAVEYVLQVCEAVAEAHTAGIVHRDLKPANLFLTERPDGSPCVKVLDFGVSKVLGDEGKLTTDRQALGSPLYMSPEQMNSSAQVDARSDIWAMGIILYELLAGKTPFHAEGIQQLCMRVMFGPPIPLGDYRPGIPPSLEAVILQCLEKERDRRWPHIAAFAAALGPFAPARAAQYVSAAATVLGVEVVASRPTEDYTAQVAATGVERPSEARTSGSAADLAVSGAPQAAAPSVGLPVLLGIGALLGIILLLAFLLFRADRAAPEAMNLVSGAPSAAPSIELSKPPSTTAPEPPIPPAPSVSPHPISSAAPTASPKTAGGTKPPSRPASPVGTVDAYGRR